MREINIISGIPGSGKTYQIIQRIQEETDLKFGYFSHSHSILEEVERSINDCIHWYGIKHLCETESSFIKNLLNIAPNRYLCTLCGKNDCLYRRQFRTNARIVLAPIQYLSTNYILDFQLDVIYIDDVINRYRLITSIKELNKWNKCLYFFEISNTLEIDLIIQKADLYSRFFESEIKGYLKLEKDLHNDDESWFKYLYEVDPEVLVEWSDVYRNFGSRDRFAFPYIYDAFKLSIGCEVNLVGAYPSVELLNKYSNNYLKSYGIEISYNYSKIRSNVYPNIIYQVISPKYGDVCAREGQCFFW